MGVPGVAVSMRYALAEMGTARSVRTLLKVNQADGFDCPSCAWGDPAAGDRKHAEFCENGAKAVAWEATRKRVDAAFFAAHPVAFLREQSDHWLEANGRLTEPMYLAQGGTHYQPIGWDDAFRLIAARLKSLDDPNRALFYTSGRASNEAAFTYQLLARRLGTNNLPDCSNMCHESSGAALTQTIGIGKGTVTLEDISDHAGLIVVVGQNPGTNHPRMLAALEEAKQRGATIVAVNPLPEAGLMRFKNPQKARGLAGHGTKLADRFLRVRVNGDLALFAGVNKALLERDDAAREAGAARVTRPRVHRLPHRRVRGRRRRVARTRLGGGRAAQRAEPGADRGVRGRRRRGGQRHRLLGDGPDAAQERGGDDPRGDELPAAARQHRPAGRGALPGARAQQRAGRPDDGRVGEDA